MQKHRQLALYVTGCTACALAAALPYVSSASIPSPRELSAGLTLIGLFAVVGAAARGLRFQRKLRRFLRLLLAGNYDAGVKVSRARDEVRALELDLETFGEQLRAYDTLRAERVRTVQLLLDVVMEQVDHPFLLLDVKRGVLELNTRFQTQFGAGQRKFSLSSLTKIESNGPLALLLEKAVETEKTPQEGRVTLQLPGSATACTLDARVFPIKNSQGAVEHALLASPS